MQLSEKPKTFREFFIAFLESILNFEHFDVPLSLSISDVIDYERRAHLDALKVLFLKALWQLTC